MTRDSRETWRTINLFILRPRLKISEFIHSSKKWPQKSREKKKLMTLEMKVKWLQTNEKYFSAPEKKWFIFESGADSSSKGTQKQGSSECIAGIYFILIWHHKNGGTCLLAMITMIWYFIVSNKEVSPFIHWIINMQFIDTKFLCSTLNYLG